MLQHRNKNNKQPMGCEAQSAGRHIGRDVWGNVWGIKYLSRGMFGDRKMSRCRNVEGKCPNPQAGLQVYM